MNFSQPKIFGFTAQFHLQNFSVSRDKTIWIEIVIPAHSLSQNVFDVRNQWNTKGFPYDFIGTVQKVNSDGKSWYSASTFIYEFFATESFRIYRTESFTYKIFQSREIKQFGWKSWFPPTLYHKMFSMSEINETLKVSPMILSALCKK